MTFREDDRMQPGIRALKNNEKQNKTKKNDSVVCKIKTMDLNAAVWGSTQVGPGGSSPQPAFSKMPSEFLSPKSSRFPTRNHTPLQRRR